MYSCMPQFHTLALAAENERMTLVGSTKALVGVMTPGAGHCHTYI